MSKHTGMSHVSGRNSTAAPEHLDALVSFACEAQLLNPESDEFALKISTVRYRLNGVMSHSTRATIPSKPGMHSALLVPSLTLLGGASKAHSCKKGCTTTKPSGCADRVTQTRSLRSPSSRATFKSEPASLTPVPFELTSISTVSTTTASLLSVTRTTKGLVGTPSYHGSSLEVLWNKD